MNKKTVSFVKWCISFFAIAWSQAGVSATISAHAVLSEILVNETTTIELMLSLSSGEEASAFEGRFQLTGAGTIADVSIASAGDPTWSSSDGNVVGSQAIFSLTSDNTGGDRVIGSLNVLGLSPGTFDVLLDSPTEALFDIDTPPFLQGVNIATGEGSLLTTVTVSEVPLPTAVWFLITGLSGLFVTGKRKK